MLVVETVAKIRRAYFVQGKSIKAICRELRISRKVVRKVLRSEATEFRYERVEQPLPRIGPWQEALDQLLASNESKQRRERLTLIRVFETLRGLGYEDGIRGCSALCTGLAARTGGDIGRCVHSAELRAGRGLPVRLEPRDCSGERRDGDREGRAHAFVPQPDDVLPGLSARDAGDGVRRARTRLRVFPRCLHARHLRQHEDRGRHDLRWQGPPV